MGKFSPVVWAECWKGDPALPDGQLSQPVAPRGAGVSWGNHRLNATAHCPEAASNPPVVTTKAGHRAAPCSSPVLPKKQFSAGEDSDQGQPCPGRDGGICSTCSLALVKPLAGSQGLSCLHQNSSAPRLILAHQSVIIGTAPALTSLERVSPAPVSAGLQTPCGRPRGATSSPSSILGIDVLPSPQEPSITPWLIPPPPAPSLSGSCLERQLHRLQLSTAPRCGNATQPRVEQARALLDVNHQGSA